MRDPARSPAIAAAAPFDVICCLFSSFTHLTSLADASLCLRSAAALLSPSGVRVQLDVSHRAVASCGRMYRTMRLHRAAGGAALDRGVRRLPMARMRFCPRAALHLGS